MLDAAKRVHCDTGSPYTLYSTALPRPDGKEANPMSRTNQAPNRAKAEILRDINAALPSLPREQQNMVAAFAQGLQTGLSLRTSDEPAPEATPEGE